MDNDQGIWENSTLVFNNCNPESTTSFINGIFENTLTNNVVSSKFLEKYFYCLWWGLQNLRYASCLLCYLILHFPFWKMTMIIMMQCFSLNKLIFPALLEWLIDNCLCFGSSFVSTELWYIFFSFINFSSYAQSLAISTYIGETLLAVLISILNLVLLAHLIGNMQVLRSLWAIMLVSYLIPFLNIPIAHPLIIPYQVQTYLQSITVRFEEWRLKRRDTEEWMRHRQIPQNLRELVRQFVPYKWLATRGVDEESILHALPTDLRRDVHVTFAWILFDV